MKHTHDPNSYKDKAKANSQHEKLQNLKVPPQLQRGGLRSQRAFLSAKYARKRFGLVSCFMARDRRPFSAARCFSAAFLPRLQRVGCT